MVVIKDGISEHVAQKVLFENTFRLNCRPKEMPSTDQIADFTLDVRTISELPSNISTMEK